MKRAAFSSFCCHAVEVLKLMFHVSLVEGYSSWQNVLYMTTPKLFLVVNVRFFTFDSYNIFAPLLENLYPRS